MIKIDIKGVQELAKRLDPGRRERALTQGLDRSGELLKGWIQKERLSGPRPIYLGVVTNRLRSSIATSDTEKSGKTLIKRLGTNVEYAAIHEFGGTINRTARIQSVFFKSFKRGKRAGRTLFSSEKKATYGRKVSVGAYTITMPERPFMRPSIEDPKNQQDILNILSEKINEALGGN